MLRPDAPKPRRYFDFDSLDRNAEKRRVFGLRVRVASLDDVIASKTAAGRPKDLANLERLNQLRQRLARYDKLLARVDHVDEANLVVGTRIAVYDALEFLASGMTHDEIMGDFPELTEAHIRATLELAAGRERRFATPA